MEPRQLGLLLMSLVPHSPITIGSEVIPSPASIEATSVVECSEDSVTEIDDLTPDEATGPEWSDDDHGRNKRRYVWNDDEAIAWRQEKDDLLAQEKQAKFDHLKTLSDGRKAARAIQRSKYVRQAKKRRIRRENLERKEKDFLKSTETDFPGGEQGLLDAIEKAAKEYDDVKEAQPFVKTSHERTSSGRA